MNIVTTHDAERCHVIKIILIYIDGELVSRDEAKISVYDFWLIWRQEGSDCNEGFEEHMDRLFEKLVKP